MRSVIKLLPVLAALASASWDTIEPTLEPGFGNAVRHNMAVHIINPVPSDVTEPLPMDGARAGVAITNYRQAIPPTLDAVATSKMAQ